MNPPALHRVKLYKLNETGGWDDKGTGLVSVGPMECSATQSNTVGLCVISEETSKMLMVHRILQDDSYNRQDETIITWTDPDIGTDVALSFQEAQGCSAIWEHIMRAQSDNDPKHPDHRRRVIDEFDGVVSHLDGDYPHPEMGGMGVQLELPAPEMGNLEEFAKRLAHVPPMHRERMAQLLLQQGCLRKLLDLFRQCEDLEDTASLHLLFRVMRCMVMLNDTQLLDELLKDEHVMDVIGCLEYDPDLTAPQAHRQFLQTAVVFKQVVPISNPEVLTKIHQTYRIQYLKDVILPRSLDDATYATLSSLMLFNNVDVVLGLYQDPAFLPRLFAALKSAAPGDEAWDDLVAFLQEFCSLAKHLQLQHRQNLWNKMSQLGMFEVITRILQASPAPVKLRATDVLLSALAHDPIPLRNHLATPGGQDLLRCLVTEFVSSRDSGLPEQIAELLKLLVDPETMEGSLDKSEFMEVFYNTCMDQLIAPVSGASSSGTSGAAAGAAAPGGLQQQAPPSGSGSGPAAAAAAPAAAAAAGSGGSEAAAAAAAAADDSSSSAVPASTIGLIVDLLCFCVQYHAFWAKYHVLRKNVVEKVLRLLKRKERWLVVAGVRFLRTCIGTKDDFYLRHLIKFDLLAPVMAAFFDNGDRYNLLNSAVLEMVDFIRRENLKSLMEYLVDKFGARFDDITYCDTFKQLQLKWEQSKEAADATGGGGGGDAAGDAAAAAGAAAGGGGLVGGRLYGSRRGRMRRDDRDLDKTEEDYFSEDSMEEDHPSPAAAADAAAAEQHAHAALGQLGGGGQRQQPGDHGSRSGGSRDSAALVGNGGGEPRLVIKGLFKQHQQHQQGGDGSDAAGVLLAALVPYGDEEEEDAENEPPRKAHKAADGSPAGASQQQQQQPVAAPPEPGQQQQQHAPGNHQQRDQQHQQQGGSGQQAAAVAAAAAAAGDGGGGGGTSGAGPASPASAAALLPDAAGAAGSSAGSQGELTPSKRSSTSSDAPAAATSPQSSPLAKRAKAPTEAAAAAAGGGASPLQQKQQPPSPQQQQQQPADAARA